MEEARMTRYRGAMLAPKAPLDNVQHLRQAGANIARVQLTMPYAESFTPERYLEELKTFFPFIKQYLTADITLALDLHTPPGGYNEDMRMVLFKDGKYAACLLHAWKLIADEFALDENAKFFDLLNEPRGSVQQVNYLLGELARTTIKTQPKKRPVVSSVAGNPTKWSEMGKVGNHCWSTAHHYWPMEFTHQGLYGHPVGRKYPTQKWNRNSMKQHLSELRQFSLQTGQRVFIGEFSCSKFADQASRIGWLQDAISIFEEWGWSACYHAWFGESDVWTPDDIAVLEVLSDWWSKNS